MITAFKVFKEDDRPQYSIEHLLNAFEDIHGAMCPRSPFFDNVQYGETSDGQPALRYTVTATGKDCIKLFDGNQGEPELITDITAWLFSMLDGAANL